MPERWDSRATGVLAALVALLCGPPARAQAPPFLLQWGTLGTGAGQLTSPRGVAVGPSGAVYVIDESRVQKFTSDGAFVRGWGTQGSLAGQFSVPYGLCTSPDGKVYVADSGNSRVEVFDADGNFLFQFGGPGSAPGQFFHPKSAACDSLGNVYVTDGLNDRIEEFDASGTFIRQWGGVGAGPGQFNLPDYVAVGPGGVVYVTDSGNNRVQKFDAQGHFLGTLGAGVPNVGFTTPVGVATDARGTVFVCDASRVQAFDSNGAFLARWGTSGSGPGQFSSSYGIATDRSGDVYVADNGNNRVQKFGPLPVTAVDPSPHVRGPRLGAPFPNPSNGVSRVAIESAVARELALAIHDPAGARVRDLGGAMLGPGSFELAWDGRDDSGRLVPPGVYWLTITSGHTVESRRLVRVR